MALFGLTSLSRSSAGSGNAANKDTPPDNKSGIRIRSVIAYTHLPGIFPRIRRLGQHFGQFAYLLALIYRSARLIPAGHPFLNGANVGRYGVRDVVATAASNLVMKRENIDQIMIFFAIGAALIMMVLQTLILLFYVAFSGTAEAAGTTGMFTTPAPGTDIMMQFLRQVFGMTSIFGTGATSLASPLHAPLYAMLSFYSTAIMLIAVIIVLYYVVTVVGESAQSGQPFGKRFNGLWAPVRLVLALGLLVPLGAGLNSAQYITLYMASFGSGLASQAWKLFTTEFNQTRGELTYTGERPDFSGVAAQLYTFEACRGIYSQLNPTQRVRIFVRYNRTTAVAQFTDAELTEARNARASTITYIWSAVRNNGTPSGEPRATCGQLSFNLTPTNAPGATPTSTDATRANLVAQQQGAYIRAVNAALQSISGGINQTPIPQSSSIGNFVQNVLPTGASPQNLSDEKIAEMAQQLTQSINSGQQAINTEFNNIRISSGEQGGIIAEMKTAAGTEGWGSAGAYYVAIAKYNQDIRGSIEAAAPSVPPTAVPFTSEPARGEAAWIAQGRAAFANIPLVVTAASQGVTTNPTPPARAGSNSTVVEGANQIGFFSNPLLWFLRWLMGDIIFHVADTRSTDPMSELIAVGGSLLGKSQTMFGYMIISKVVAALGPTLGRGAASLFMAGVGTFQLPGLGTAAGALLGLTIGNYITAIAGAIGDVLYFFIMLGLVGGIVLFYILPMMPFMYFFFASVNWVIEVVEAVISMPLFALAHLRIDGEGLPGQTAMTGYMAWFGILFRPILIIISFIFSILLFGAAAFYLNATYKYAIFAYRGTGSALVDFNSIGSFGLVFYSVFYIYILYILASSIFKLIDKVPDEMMRWIGGPKSFTGDKTPDIGNVQTLAASGYVMMTQGSQALSKAGSRMSQSKNSIDSARRPQAGQRGETSGASGGG